MKKNIHKIFITVLFTILLSSISMFSYAAPSYSISSGISSIEVGKTYTVTIKASGITGRFNISHSSNVSVDRSSVWVENGSASIKVTAKSAGKATVTATPEEGIADSETGNLLSLSSKTDTVTIKEKSTSSSSSSSSSTSSLSSSSSSSTTTTTKPTFTSKNQTVYATSEVNVRSSYSTSSSVLGTLKAGDSVKRTGIATKSVDGILWSKITYNGQTAYVSSSFLTTTKPEEKDDEDEEKSGNANLKALSVTPTGLSPVFSSGTTEYTMTVGLDIEKIDVDAVAEDEKAKVSVTGNTDLEVGTNTISVKVTAEDETTKTYKITVTKEDKEQVKLKELLVEGLPLEPEFDSNIYEYTLTLDRNDVSELNVTATPDRDDAEIEIVGNTELQIGENVITILVKLPDEEEITTYQITVNVPETMAGTTIDNQNLYKYIGIGVLAAILLIIIIVAIVKRHKNNDDEYETYYGGIDNSKNDNNSDTVEKIKMEDLPKLNDEDLPKSLRKHADEENKQEDILEETTDRNKKIDELYYAEDGLDSRRKRGKHF